MREQYDYTDGDQLQCLACDRFIDTLNPEGLCLVCAGEEE